MFNKQKTAFNNNEIFIEQSVGELFSMFQKGN